MAAAFIVAVTAIAGLVTPVSAQTGTIAGTVVDGKSGRPLPDASVRVDGGTLIARTGTRGEFRLTGVVDGAVKLRINRIGYVATTADAKGGDMTVKIEMTELVVKLDELVVTGTAAEASKRTLGNAIGQVDVAGTLALSGPPAKLQDMLSVVP